MMQGSGHTLSLNEPPAPAAAMHENPGGPRQGGRMMAVEDDVVSQPTDTPDLSLPTVNIGSMSVALTLGLSARYVASCASWTTCYMLGDWLKGVPSADIDRRNKRRAKIWLTSHAWELGASLLLTPGRYLTGKTASRLLFDFTFTGLGETMATVDRFSPPHYLAYAVNRLTPANGAEYDYSFFAWQLPATLVTSVKLYLRRQRSREDTKTWRCAGAIAVQYALRVLLLSSSVYLPRNEEELLMTWLLVGVDKALDAYLIRNTWPWPAEDVAKVAAPQK